MIRCVVCGRQAVREFVSRTIFTDIEQDRFALCETHKEALYDFLAARAMEKEEERDGLSIPTTIEKGPPA